MITFNKYFLSKFELTNNTIKLKFSESTLNHLITNRIGKPTTKDEIKYYKNKLNKLSPLIFNKLKPKVKLIKKTLNKDQFPKIDVPEICVYGSYNVGKSTLVNSLLNKSNLCKTNVKTSQLHFYQVGKPPMILIVDMPGYYNNNPINNNNNNSNNKDNLEDNKNNPINNNNNNSNNKDNLEDNKNNPISNSNERENKILEFSLSYLKYRTNLMLTIILIDSVKGICEEDLKIINFCNCHKLNFLIALNKCDLVKPIELTKRLQVVKSQLGIFKFQIGQIVAISALKLQNLNELRELLTQIYVNNTNLNKDSISNNKALVRDNSNNRINNTNHINDTSKVIKGNMDNNLINNDNNKDMDQTKELSANVGNSQLLKLNVDGNLIKLNVDNLSIINSLTKVSKDSGKSEDLLDNNLINEKNELFERRLSNYLATHYRVSKFKINRSYKRVFSLFKANLLKNSLLNYKMLRSSAKAKVNRSV